MNLVLKFFLMSVLFFSRVVAVESLYPIDNLCPIDNIVFKNKDNREFTLVPFHVLDKQKTVDDLYQLFQNPKVYTYYEKGVPKDRASLENKFDRVSKRFKNWQKDQLGWVAILDKAGCFVGFIGARIVKDTDPYTVEVCGAVDPMWQRTKVMTNGCMEYMNYFWPKLDQDICLKIKSIKSPTNPRDEASIGFAKFFYANSVGNEVYVPKYYEHISVGKGQRVWIEVPIEIVLKKCHIDNLYPIDNLCPIDNIVFKNKDNREFTLVPFHVLDKQKTVDDLYQLFQNPKVYTYYEKGVPKDRASLENKFDRVSGRFENWQKDQLGWVAILDKADFFVGFIGARIVKDTDPYTVEVCGAVDPMWQRTKVMTNGCMEYMNYFWPKLDQDICLKIKSIKSPTNPRDEASIGFAKFFYANSVGNEVYVPKYYEHISLVKGQRVWTEVPIDIILQKVKEYKENLNKK